MISSYIPSFSCDHIKHWIYWKCRDSIAGSALLDHPTDSPRYSFTFSFLFAFSNSFIFLRRQQMCHVLRWTCKNRIQRSRRHGITNMKPKCVCEMVSLLKVWRFDGRVCTSRPSHRFSTLSTIPFNSIRFDPKEEKLHVKYVANVSCLARYNTVHVWYGTCRCNAGVTYYISWTAHARKCNDVRCSLARFCHFFTYLYHPSVEDDLTRPPLVLEFLYFRYPSLAPSDSVGWTRLARGLKFEISWVKLKLSIKMCWLWWLGCEDN